MAIIKASSADLLARLGIFVQREFLAAADRARICREIAQAPQEGAKVADPQGAEALDESVRKVKEARVPAETSALVEAKMLALKPAFERHFKLQLKGCETLKFLSYKEGGFYKTHCDQGDDEDSAAAYYRARKLSLVVFLNAQAERPAAGCYGGGALSFYGLIDGPSGERSGVPLSGTTPRDKKRSRTWGCSSLRLTSALI